MKSDENSALFSSPETTEQHSSRDTTEQQSSPSFRENDGDNLASESDSSVTEVNIILTESSESRNNSEQIQICLFYLTSSSAFKTTTVTIL
ncbi:hypothetical protein WA026_018210 [Henosepilachna vigintioctopunctata]|uniref:Uncharacterized protein n=1 Tax=Henosepilachna vigintioctopunctata TaxID=420089 RepID=A0AAW1VI47_9CUCU